MNAQNKSNGNEDYPKWYDIKIFPGSLDEFRELYGQESELVKLEGPHAYIDGIYIDFDVSDKYDSNELINPANEYIKRLKDGKTIKSENYDDETFKQAIHSSSALVRKLRKIQADGIIRAEPGQYREAIDSVWNGYIGERFFRGIPVRSEKMKKRLEGKIR